MHIFRNTVSLCSLKVYNHNGFFSFRYEGDYTKPYTFIAGAEVSQSVGVNEEIENIIIPKGKYAKFVIIGDVQNSVGQAWQEIWNMDLKRKYTYDFEEYQNNLSDMQKQEIHIYIAIED